jgi:hypothetical protein
MSRWRHILLASPPSFSACPKPTAEKKHDPSPTDNEIKNGDIRLLSARALRDPWKAVPFNKVDALSGTKASPLRNSHCANARCFCRLRAWASQASGAFLNHCAEILPPHYRFVVARLPEMDEPLLEVG